MNIEMAKIVRGLSEIIAGPLISFIRKQIKRTVNQLLKQLMMAFAALVFLLTGLVFVSIGFVKGLSVVIPAWAAYCIVGLALALIGLFLLLVSMLREK